MANFRKWLLDKVAGGGLFRYHGIPWDSLGAFDKAALSLIFMGAAAFLAFGLVRRAMGKGAAPQTTASTPTISAVTHGQHSPAVAQGSGSTANFYQAPARRPANVVLMFMDSCFHFTNDGDEPAYKVKADSGMPSPFGRGCARVCSEEIDWIAGNSTKTVKFMMVVIDGPIGIGTIYKLELPDGVSDAMQLLDAAEVPISLSITWTGEHSQSRRCALALSNSSAPRLICD